jgi:GNAT superfamily N-acetyltransferase
MKIRPARVQESQVLTELCKRSKATWGYDAGFLRMAEGALTITQDFIATGDVFVAEKDSVLLGVASIVPLKEDGVFDLVHLFVEPGAMSTGIGRALFTAAAELSRARGGNTLRILSDPYAASFYRRMGASDLGDAPSDWIPGRMIPSFTYRL